MDSQVLKPVNTVQNAANAKLNTMMVSASFFQEARLLPSHGSLGVASIVALAIIISSMLGLIGLSAFVVIEFVLSH